VSKQWREVVKSIKSVLVDDIDWGPVITELVEDNMLSMVYMQRSVVRYSMW